MRPLLLAALLSCADEGIGWDLPADMLPEERAAFGEGIELCNEIAIRQQHIALPGEGTHRVVLRRPSGMVNAGADGEYGYEERLMQLERGQPRAQFTMVVAHEALHAAGVVGHHEGRGIMHANGSMEEPLAWTHDDIEKCRRAKACR
jgi:hypothetical protein